ncbi:MAG: MFS transporter [Desulfobacteraceae bacterium]|nr:MAG: MFS transporter [Desulfobacteraceae bacterium]
MEASQVEASVVIEWKRTLYIMVFAQMISVIGFSCVFPFLPLYVKSLGTVTSLSVEVCIGLVYSGQAFTMVIASPIWGWLSDRRGRKLMVQRAMLGGAVIVEMMAFAASAEQLVALRAVQGMVSGVIGAANALVAASVPREHVGFAMGLLQVGMGVGLGLGPVIGGTVADAFGYRAVFHVTAGLLSIAFVVVFWGVEERFVKPQTGRKRSGFFSGWGRVLSAPGVLVVFCLRFLNSMGRMIFMPILPMFILPLIDKLQGGNGLTGIVIGISSAATAIFAVFLGRLGDRTGHRRTLIICLLCCFVSFVLQSQVVNYRQLLVLQIIYGIALGGIIPGISALLACTTTQGDEGSVYGLDNSINAAGRTIAPLIGVGISVWFGLRAVFNAAGLLYLLAALFALIALRGVDDNKACKTIRGPGHIT